MNLPTLEIKVDTTELDAALKKLEVLCERAEKVDSHLTEVVAALAAATASVKPVTRRSLLLGPLNFSRYRP